MFHFLSIYSWKINQFPLYSSMTVKGQYEALCICKKKLRANMLLISILPFIIYHEGDKTHSRELLSSSRENQAHYLAHNTLL